MSMRGENERQEDDDGRSHPDEVAIREFALGILKSDAADRVAEHLEFCPDCQRIFDDVDLAADALIAGWRDANQNRTELHQRPAENETPSPHAETVGDYQLVRMLGAGGMGVVYEGRHRVLARTAAVKLISQTKQRSGEYRDRFRREAKAVARLKHPNVVQLLEFGEQDGQLFCAFEFVEGGSLADTGDRTQRDSAQLLERLARAVAHAHENGVLHRDLKPANILIAKDGTPKIADFGLAKQVEGDSLHTDTGALLGTASYMAPEQAAGKTHAVSHLVDVYGLGAILYEELCGRPPFCGESPLQTLDLVRTREVQKPSTLRQSVARDLETICLRCLEKDPADRYPSAVALAEDLRRYLNGEPILARPVGRGERLLKWCKRHPARTGFLLACLAVGVLLALYAQRVGLDRTKNREVTNRLKAKDERIAETERSRYALRLRDLLEESRVDPPQRTYEQLSDTEDFPERLRDVSWRLLRARCATEMKRPLVTQRSSPKQLSAIALAGTNLLVGSEDGSLQVWDASDTDASPTILDGHGDRVTRIVVDAIGRRAASAGRDGQVIVWDLEFDPPRKSASLELPRSGGNALNDVNAVAFLDDQQIALAGASGEVRLWRYRDQPKSTVLGRHERSVLCLAVSTDGRWLLSGGRDARIRIWDWRQRAKVGELATHSKPVAQLHAWQVTTGGGEASQRFASATTGGDRLKLWRLDEDGAAHALNDVFAHEKPISSLATLRDGTRLMTGGGDGWIRIWDQTVAANRPVVQFQADALRIHAVAVSADEKRLYTVGDDNWKSFDLSLEFPLELPPHKTRITGLAVPNARTLYSASEDGTLQLWSIGDEVVSRRSEDLTSIRDLALAGDGSALALAADGAIHYRSLPEDAGSTRELPTDALWHDGVALSSTGSQVVATGGIQPGAALLTLSAAGASQTSLAPDAGETMAVAFHPDDKTIAIGDAAGTLHLVRLATGETTRRALHRKWIARIAFAPDGRRLATASADGTIAIWSDDGAHLKSLSGHVGAVRSLLYTPDGRTLISGGEDRTIRCWDPVVGDERIRLTAHPAAVTRLAISPDGQTLVSGDESGQLRIWRTAQVD